MEPSGDACDHYHRYPDDMPLLAALGFTAYRFSLEWSRIEPEEGHFSRAALDHYRRMCAACHEHGIEAIVTFHHFTTPRWVAARGGWTEPATATASPASASAPPPTSATSIARACTLNEPNIVATFGHRWGLFPPGRARPRAAPARQRRLRRRASQGGRRHQGRPRRAGPSGSPSRCRTTRRWTAATCERDSGAPRSTEDVFLEAARGDDFIGVQTYTRLRFGPDGMRGPEPGVPTTPMGYEFWPEALEATIRRAWEVTRARPAARHRERHRHRPTTRSASRTSSARCAACSTASTTASTCAATSYWSLLDNFEWVFGYRPTFGLVAVDRVTQQRTVKPSARWLGAVARANRLELPAAGAATSLRRDR